MSERFASIYVERRDSILFAVLARPNTRNAIDRRMVDELHRVCALAEAGRDAPDATGAPEEAEPVRAVLLRGAGNVFCAGGDVTEMREALADEPGGNGSDDPLFGLNRAFGALLQRLDALPCPVVAAVEGVALGGGLGLACVADWVLTTRGTVFGMPEVRLGLVPAQIAPWVVRRMGVQRARGLAVLGRTIDGTEATRLGLADEVHADVQAMEQALAHRLSEILLCAPRAMASTKELISRVGDDAGDDTGVDTAIGDLLDDGARRFTDAARGDEAAEGMGAFLARRTPSWAPQKPMDPETGS